MRTENKVGLWQGFRNLWRYYRGWKWLIFLGLLSSLLLSSYLVLLAKTTSVDTLKVALQTQTTILDQNDQEVGQLNAQKGTYVNLDHISEQMKQTVVNTEDKRFYEHNGFDTMGIGRAFVRMIINRNTSGGGGSTLTQQLAKNAFLSQDQTLQRKLKELFLALEIEKTYDKDQILEMYLNHAYFGNGVWGVEDASQKYFGHPASDLDWGESMVLTGILKGPNLFNPIDDYQAAIDRRNVIADLLLKEGVISQEDNAYVKSQPINLYDNYYVQDHYTYPSYFDAVINEAIRETKIPEADLIAKGYKIYTYLNPAYQDVIDQSYQSGIFPDDGTGTPLVQSASVVLDPKTGGVQAVYGGRGDYVYRGFNRATDMRRAPGSTIKPMAVYVPALESGYTIHSMVPDQVKSYDGYAPENYNHYTDPSGEVALYYALAQSKNTSAVYLMDKMGIDRSVKKLSQFGIQIKEDERHLTLALGALDQGVSPQQLADAYSAFANQGIRNESFFIRKIEDATGKVVYSNEKPAKHMVMTRNVAADMTSMMLDTYGGYGTGYGAGPDIGLLAGKTGSTETVDGSTQTRDKWMVGFTPDFVIVTWMGLDKTGDVSLDELMPSGLGTLFKLQTTGIIGLSPQTPFKETFASQMVEDTNKAQSDQWQDSVGEWFDNAYQWVSENAPKAWEQVKQSTGDAFNSLSQWIGDLDLPF